MLRRLQRLAPSCQYFACSATVRDASGHASSLLPPSSRQLVVIDDDASPRGPKQVVVWNPEEMIVESTYGVQVLGLDQIR